MADTPQHNGNGRVLGWFRTNGALIVILLGAGISVGRNWQQIDRLNDTVVSLQREISELRRQLDDKSGSAMASEAGRTILLQLQRAQETADRNYRLIVELQDQLNRRPVR